MEGFDSRAHLNIYPADLQNSVFFLRLNRGKALNLGPWGLGEPMIPNVWNLPAVSSAKMLGRLTEDMRMKLWRTCGFQSELHQFPNAARVSCQSGSQDMKMDWHFWQMFTSWRLQCSDKELSIGISSQIGQKIKHINKYMSKTNQFWLYIYI